MSPQDQDEEANENQGSVARTVHEIFLTSFLGGEDELLDLEVLGPAFARLAESMTDDVYDAGQVVYEAGQPAREFLFVASGAVVVKTAEGAVMEHQARSVVGGAEVTMGRPHPQTATAKTRAHIVRLPRETLYDVMEDYFVIAQVMLRNAATSLQAIRLLFAAQDRYLPPKAHDVIGPKDDELNLVNRIIALRSSQTFHVAPMQAVTKLADIAEPVSFDAGQSISGADSPGTIVYVVLSGTVEARHRENQGLMGRFAGGEVVFIDAVLAKRFTEYDVTAMTEASILTFDTDDLFDVMEEHQEVVRGVLVKITDDFEHLMKYALDHSGQPVEGPGFKMSRTA